MTGIAGRRGPEQAAKDSAFAREAAVGAGQRPVRHGRTAWHPDGGRLLVSTSKGLLVVEVASKDVTRLPDPRPDKDSGERTPVLALHDATISPDGTRIAFSTYAADPDARGAEQRIFTMRLDGTDVRRVSPPGSAALRLERPAPDKAE